MLVGCGCHCETGSDSFNPSAAGSGDWSGSFPSQSSWPESIPPSEPYLPYPCSGCIAGVRPTAYRVTLGKPGMTQRPPSGFGDWGCADMLKPFKIEAPSGPPGIDALFPVSPVDSYPPYNCYYGTRLPDPPNPPPALGDPIDCSRYINGQFIPRDVVSNSVCAPVPQTSMRIKTFDDGIQLRHVMQFVMRFHTIYSCSPAGGPQGPLWGCYVEYETEVVTSPFACMGRIPLTWKRGGGLLRRRNPDPEYPGQWEAYGIAPGNNITYEFHRGTFPETIFIEPWRTV